MRKLNVFLLAICFVSNCFSQEKYPAKVVDGPNFASDLFYLSQQRIINQVPHLKNLDLTFGIANWYFTTTPSVAAATSYINVELNSVNYVGFVMKMPNGADKRVSLSELGITPYGYNIVDIKLNIEFGKIGVNATTEIDFNGSFTKSSKGSGSLRFKNSEDFNKFSKFISDNKLKTTQEIFSALNPQVTFTYKGSYNGSILSEYNTFFLKKINTYIQKIWLENEKQNKINTILKSANTEAQIGNLENAKAKFEEAYQLKADPNVLNELNKIKQRIKEKKEAEFKAKEVNNAGNNTNTANTSSNSPTKSTSSSSKTATSTTKKETTTEKKDTYVKKSNTIGNTGKTFEQLEYERRAYEQQQKDKLKMAVDPGGYAMQKSGLNDYYKNEIAKANRESEIRRAKEEREEERAERDRKRRKREREEELRKQQEAENIKRAEEKRIADIKLREDRNQWEATNAPIFRKQLAQWNDRVNAYINSDLSKYQLMKGDQLPHWIAILSLAVDRMIVSEKMTPSEKKEQINIAWRHAEKYRELCRNYNFQGQLEPNTEQSLSKIFEYTRSNNGYDALSQSFSYGITKKEVPLQNTISYGDPYYSSNLYNLHYSYGKINLKLKKGIYSKNQVYNFYARKRGGKKAGMRKSETTQPYLYRPLIKEHLDFLEDLEAYLPNDENSGPSSLYSPEIFIKPYRIRAVHYYSLHNQQKKLLFEYYTLLSLMNIPDIDAFIKIPIANSNCTSPESSSSNDFKMEDIALSKASNTKRKTFKKIKTKSWEITFSIAHALYLNGYFKESELLFKQLYDTGVLNKKIDVWGRIFSEALSFYMASLYHQGKYQEVINYGETFKNILSIYDLSGKPNDVLSYYNLLIHRDGLDIHQDMYVHTVYARGICYWALSLSKLNKIKEAKIVLNPIKKGLKEDIPLLYYQSESYLISKTFEEIDKKTYDKYMAAITIKNAYSPIDTSIQIEEQNNNPEKWQTQYQTTIDSLNYYYKEKSYKKVINLGRQLLPSLHFKAAQENSVYLQLMQRCAEACLYEGKFAYGVTFANYSLNPSKQTKSMVLLLLNAIFLNEGNIQLAGIEPKGIDGYKETYHLVNLLESYDSDEIDGNSGKKFLMDIEKEMARNKVETIFTPYLYYVLNRI